MSSSIDTCSDKCYTIPSVNNVITGGLSMDMQGREVLTFKTAGDGENAFIPHGLERMSLSGNEYAAYFILLMSIGPNDRAEISYSELAERTKTSRRTAIRALAGLEERGLVKRVKQSGENGSLLKNAYEVYRPILKE